MTELGPRISQVVQASYIDPPNCNYTYYKVLLIS